MADPLGFGLFRKLVVMWLSIVGLFIVLVIETTLHILYGRTNKIIEAFGHFGRKVVDEISHVFK